MPGARGPAVEDIQKRLLRLGFELGPTGVDGVFLGKTREAVEAFQSHEQLAEDGVVGDLTWSALVDATFILGDRMLYLRLPHLHGHDVGVLQRALNTLGFACGAADGIFGTFTERAVREFQRNCGQPHDGIVGPETVRSIVGLRHVWEGKDATMPTSATAAPARSVAPLLQSDVWLSADDPASAEVGERVANLARASDERARVHPPGTAHSDVEGLVLELASDVGDVAGGVPVVVLGDDASSALVGRLVTALSATSAGCGRVAIELGQVLADERDKQRVAIRLLDALCVALA